MRESLFPPAFFQALESLARKRSYQGQGVAESLQPGEANLGFERRPRQAGDRLSDLDWRSSARSSEFWVRKRESDQGGHLIIALDCSASLTPETALRERRQLQLACAAGYLALISGSSVQICTSQLESPPISGVGRFALLQRFLEELPSAQGPDTAVRLPTFAQKQTRVLAFSDPWASSTWWNSFKVCGQSRLDWRAVCLLMPEEENPPNDVLQLQEVETGQTMKVDLRGQRGAYRDAWEAWLLSQSSVILSHGGKFVRFLLSHPEGDYDSFLKSAEELHVV